MSQRTGPLVKGGLEVVIECATRAIYMVFDIHLSSSPGGRAPLPVLAFLTSSKQSISIYLLGSQISKKKGVLRILSSPLDGGLISRAPKG